jgi:hypothetical protein
MGARAPLNVEGQPNLSNLIITNVRSTAAPYTESRLTRSVANERIGFPVVEQRYTSFFKDKKSKRSHKTEGIKVFPINFAS